MFVQHNFSVYEFMIMSIKLLKIGVRSWMNISDFHDMFISTHWPYVRLSGI